MGHGGSFHDLALRGRALDPEMRTAAPKAENPTTAAAEGPSFWDFLDVLNPLQHLPIIGGIYRNLTGDQIAPMARTIGGALFGGPLGLVASVYENAVVQTSGKDFGQQIASLLGGDDDLAIDQLPQRMAAADVNSATKPDAETPPADAAPLNLTIHANDHIHLSGISAPPAASPTITAQPVMLAQATEEPSKPMTAPAASPASPPAADATFMPLNDKVRRVPKNVKFRTVPGLSSAQIFNPKNARPAPGAEPTPADTATQTPLGKPAQGTPPIDVDGTLAKAVAAQNSSQTPIDLNDKMLRALDKYQSMQRMGGPTDASRLIDRAE